MKQIDDSQSEISIIRVANGWIVTAGGMGGAMARGYVLPTHVARTPKELADLLTDWAQRQNDKPPSPAA